MKNASRKLRPDSSFDGGVTDSFISGDVTGSFVSGDVTGDNVCFGDRLQLWTQSHYLRSFSTDIADEGQRHDPGPVGYYSKEGRHGVLSVVPPLYAARQTETNKFYPSTFTVAHLQGDVLVNSSSRISVSYGEPCFLVDERDMVWNNRTGLTSRVIGPRPREWRGEMCISFSAPGKQQNDPVRFGDQNVTIQVASSKRFRTGFNKSLSNYKKASSSVVGGYISSDGSGFPLLFEIRPARRVADAVDEKSLFPPETLTIDSVTVSNGPKQTKIAVQGEGGQARGISLAQISAQDNLLVQIRTSNGCKIVPLHCPPVDRESASNDVHSTVSLHAYGFPGLQLLATWTPRGAPAFKVPSSGLSTLLEQDEVFSTETRPSLSVRVQECLMQQESLAVLGAISVALLGLGMRSSLYMGGALAVVMLILLVRAVVIRKREVHASTQRVTEQPALEERPFQPVGLKTRSNGLGSRSVSQETLGYVSDFTLTLVVERSSQVQRTANPEVAIKPVNDPAPATLEGPNGIEKTTEGQYIDQELRQKGFPPMTERWVRAEKGNVASAMARYKVTMQWRRDNDIDGILDKPHPWFFVIKEIYPHYYHHTDREGHVWWYEAPGGVDMKRLKDLGVTAETMHFHFLYVTEYLWKHLAPDDNASCFSVINMDGVTMSNARGEALDYTRKNAKLLGEHYPERSFRTLVINAPFWLHTIYKLVAVMLDPVTRTKIFVLPASKSRAKILEYVDEENLPATLNGGGGELGSAPQEQALNEHVRTVLRAHNQQPHPLTDK